MRKISRILLSLILVVWCLILPACSGNSTGNLPARYDQAESQRQVPVSGESPTPTPSARSAVTVPGQPSASPGPAAFSLKSVPAYQGYPYITINNNHPFFTSADLTTVSFESYSDLDRLGRCGVAYANVSQDTLPVKKRGAIGHVKPSGWHTVKYDIVNGKYLYNRCHLIGYQLTAENDNVMNLITGTRYLNVEGMLPFENMVADYIKETGNHVLYRVTPMFDGNNLVAAGVLMEALSVEDVGEAICYNVFCYNSQPGVFIDYSTGVSYLSGDITYKPN